MRVRAFLSLLHLLCGLYFRLIAPIFDLSKKNKQTFKKLTIYETR